MTSNKLKLSLTLPVLLASAGCQTIVPKQEEKKQEYVLNNSYLEQTASQQDTQRTSPTASQTKKEQKGFQRLTHLNYKLSNANNQVDFSQNLNDTNKNITIAADNLSLSQFTNYILAEVLKLDYIIDETLTNSSKHVTLNIAQAISQKEAYLLLLELLDQSNYTIAHKGKLLYIIPIDEKKQTKNLAFAVGKHVSDIPNTNQEVFQIVPLKFASASSFSLLLRSLAGIQVSQSKVNNLLYLQGKREGIVRALEFLSLVDKPTPLAKNIGFISLVYNSATEHAEQLKTIMANEGISVGINNMDNHAVVLVPLENKGKVIVFALDDTLLSRTEYWSNELDKANNTAETNFFIYRPQYARATDLGESLSNMLSVNGLSQAGNLNDKSQGNKSSQQTQKRSSGSIDTPLTISVDERSNSLIIYGTANEYQKVRPLLLSLDVLPKQIMLEVTIAEVTLKDDFKMGVEWTLSNGNYNLGTAGALGLDNIAGLSYSITGIDGALQAKFSQDNNLINVLSRPSIVVRDGVAANISVGTDIPIVGSTTSDPDGDRQTTSIDYRKTGIELEVTPTVNSQGVVIMEINQKISNTVDGGVNTGGSPSIFERAIKTEVVAGSGQTVILGGLISDNKTKANSRVPILGDIPVLGNLFKVQSDLNDKTELVVLVTPKIIQRQEEWNGLKSRFFNTLDNLQLKGNIASTSSEKKSKTEEIITN